MAAFSGLKIFFFFWPVEQIKSFMTSG